MDRNCRIWNKSKLLPIGGDARVLERLSYCVELVVGSGNNILLLLRCQLLSASLQGQLEKAFLVDGTPRHRDPPLFMEHVGNTTARSQVAVVLRKDAADFRGGAVLVVRRGLYNNGNATGRVTFVDDLVEMLGLDSFARAALDRAVDVVVRHALGAGGENGAAEPGVTVRIASAGFRRDGDFPGKLAEERAAFRIERALEPLNLGPLAVSRHEMGILSCRTDLCSSWNPESLEESSLSRRQINEGIKTPRAVFVKEMRLSFRRGSGRASGRLGRGCVCEAGGISAWLRRIHPR